MCTKTVRSEPASISDDATGLAGRRGLTLLEVLAAVAVVGLTFVVFAQAGGESLHRQGENKRRIEATLVADQTLAELEGELDRGLVPREGIEERNDDFFDVEIEIAGLSLELPTAERGAPHADRRPDPNNLLGSPTRPGSGALRRIDVRVRWSEGFSEREINRTTFAFDASGAQAVLESLLEAAAANASGEAGGRESDEEESEETRR